MKKFILCLFIGMVFLSCSGDDELKEGFLVFYDQTQCADPWGYAENNSELAGKISNFFEAENIEISNVKIDNKGTQEVCNACFCLSGKRIITIVSKHDLSSIMEFGFRKYD